MMTIAEQIALLTPTPTTYTPMVGATKERPLAYSFRKGVEVERVELGTVGPGSYEPSKLKQDPSSRWTSSLVWTGRLPRELEPVKEKYTSAAPFPPPPKLEPLY